LSKEVAEAARTRASLIILDPHTGLQNKKIIKINVDLDLLRRTLFQCHEYSEVYIGLHKDTEISIENGVNDF